MLGLLLITFLLYIFWDINLGTGNTGSLPSKSSILRNYKSQNLSIFGNIDYFLNEQYKLAFGMRWENWDSKYNDSNNE